MTKRLIFLVGIIFIVFLPELPSSAVSINPVDPVQERIVIVSIPGLSFQEINPSSLQNYPQFGKISEQGMVGALNIRTPFKGIEDSYLTIGAGAYASSRAEYEGMQRGELKHGSRGEHLFKKYVGEDVGSATLFIPEIAAIQRMNAENYYQAKPGLLGDILEEAGISVAMFGNLDRGKQTEAEYGKSILKRTAPLMMMNGKGKIAFGSIDQTVLLTDVERPFAVKTNYDFMLQQLNTLSRRSVMLFELGDFDRLYEERERYAVERFREQKAAIMGELDSFVGSIMAQMTERDRLLIFSPQVHADAEREKMLLAPVLLFGHGVEQGIVSSNTTRRSGIVANLDIAPTILRNFALEQPADMIGYPFVYEAKQENLAWLHDEVDDRATIYRLRPRLLYPFVTYQMVVLLIGLLFSIYYKTRSALWIGVPLLSVLVAPIVLLRLNVTFSLPELLVTVLFFTIIVIVAALLYRYPLYGALALLSTLTVLLLVVDGLFGAVWMSRSVLGYDPMIGARYYGIGNEYMGVLIGATVLCVSLGLHYYHARYPKFILLASSVLFVAIIFYLSSPMLGTNAGGAIAATVTFGVAWLRMFGGKMLREVRWRHLLLVVSSFGVLALGGLWLLNVGWLNDVPQQSHIGRAMQMLLSGRVDVIGGIVARKLSMNWHLITVSSWSKVLITSLFVIMVIVLRPRGIFAKWQTTIPFIMYGFSANAIGSIVVLLVNDSGIVAAATLIVYVAVPMLLIKLQDIKASHAS